jgi:antitoxin (DNA-binding transcriptional repressor) of toxin-antitoxin stability system
MKEMSASEVARSFSAALDGAEGGETIVITRGGRRVAMLVPAPRANGGTVLDVLATWRGRLAVDDALASAVEAADQSQPGLDEDPWRD